MALVSRIGNMLKQASSRNVSIESSLSNLSLCQAVRSMSSKLFVGGLPYSIDDVSLREAFAQHGEVTEARVIIDHSTGRSRGFGFVRYTSSEDATSAKNAMDGQDLQGRMVRVDFAQDRPPRQGGYGGGNNYGGGYGNYGGGGGGYGGGSSYGGGYGNSGGYSGGNSGGYGGGSSGGYGGNSGGYGGGNSGGYGGGSRGGFSGGNNGGYGVAGSGDGFSAAGGSSGEFGDTGFSGTEYGGTTGNEGFSPDGGDGGVPSAVENNRS